MNLNVVSTGNGYITTGVLRDILHELDDKLTPDDLDAIIEEIDEDGSGTIDFDGRTFSNFIEFFFPVLTISISSHRIHGHDDRRGGLNFGINSHHLTDPKPVYLSEQVL